MIICEFNRKSSHFFASMRRMTFADVPWMAVEPQNDNWNFVRPDSAIMNSCGIHAIPALYHIGAGNPDAIGLQVPWRACSTAGPGCGWEATRDSSDSKDYVQTVVARYPSRVKYWEIANEMSGKKRRPFGLPVDDIRGQRVRTLVRDRQSAGSHSVKWDGRDARGQAVASGVYLYLLQAGGRVHIRRMVLMR